MGDPSSPPVAPPQLACELHRTGPQSLDVQYLVQHLTDAFFSWVQRPYSSHGGKAHLGERRSGALEIPASAVLVFCKVLIVAAAIPEEVYLAIHARYAAENPAEIDELRFWCEARKYLTLVASLRGVLTEKTSIRSAAEFHEAVGVWQECAHRLPTILMEGLALQATCLVALAPELATSFVDVKAFDAIFFELLMEMKDLQRTLKEFEGLRARLHAVFCTDYQAECAQLQTKAFSLYERLILDRSSNDILASLPEALSLQRDCERLVGYAPTFCSSSAFDRPSAPLNLQIFEALSALCFPKGLEQGAAPLVEPPTLES
jgi:hypothetical protein